MASGNKRGMKSNPALAKELGCTLYAALPADAKDKWIHASGQPLEQGDCKDGWRCFLQYRVADIYKNPTDWESLQAATDVLREVVPLVCDVEVEAATAALAIEKVLDEMDVPGGHY